MTDRFNDPELQKQWKDYQDYIALHSGQAILLPSFEEWSKDLNKLGYVPTD